MTARLALAWALALVCLLAIVPQRALALDPAVDISQYRRDTLCCCRVAADGGGLNWT